MSVLVLSVVAIIILIALVYFKTKLEHDIESNVIEKSNISNKKVRKRKNKVSKMNTTKQEGALFSKKLAISFTGIVIEIILVFLGITGALEFDNYLERKDVLLNVSFTRAYVDATYEMAEELLLAYREEECDADDIRFNLTFDSMVLDAVIDSDEARRHINPSAMAFLFNVDERVHDLIKVMNNDAFDDTFLSNLIEEILYQLDLLSKGLTEVEIYLAGGGEEDLYTRLLILHQEFTEHKSGADLLG